MLRNSTAVYSIVFILQEVNVCSLDLKSPFSRYPFMTKENSKTHILAKHKTLLAYVLGEVYAFIFCWGMSSVPSSMHYKTIIRLIVG